MSAHVIKSKLVRRRWAFSNATGAAEFFYYIRAMLGIGVDCASLDQLEGSTEVRVTCSHRIARQLEIKAPPFGGVPKDPWTGKMPQGES